MSRRPGVANETHMVGLTAAVLGLINDGTDMVKTRLQSGAKGFNGPVGAAMSIYRNEGISGFYRGAYVRLQRPCESCCPACPPTHQELLLLLLQAWART